MKLKKGDRVRWRFVDRLRQHKKESGMGKITRVIRPFGNVPWTCEVDTYKRGVLFEDEVKRA